MCCIWYETIKTPPPNNTILLVQSPLGVDLAMYIEGRWYFKIGDDWDLSNLELWFFQTPTMWAEIGLSEAAVSPGISLFLPTGSTPLEGERALSAVGAELQRLPYWKG